ncbi:sarcotoxin II-1-like [Musca vetustissima]|uniref:sarcotoxin II-1-like n=1 Tax=Musca vetustissima TaxID=27455 RepID=UPI002AB7F0D3|nr:sarcotoxin II-1-like [Musca vetustissima]
MKCILLMGACVGILAFATLSVAQPPRVYGENLPYYSPPIQAESPLRVRRSPDNPSTSNGVSIKTNSVSSNIFSSPSNNVDGTVTQSKTYFPNGEFSESSSGSLDWKNSLGVGGSLSRDINTGVSDSFTKSVGYNIFNNDRNSVDALYSHTNTKLNNGFGFNKESGTLKWTNEGGHGLSGGVSRFEGFGKQASVTGHTNLFKSDDGNTRIDAFGSGSKWLSGPLQNQRDYNFGIGGSHYFRG